MDIASIANLTIEGVDMVIPKALITDDSLAAQFRNTRATRVSNRLFRVVTQIALAGGDSRNVNLDGGPLPLGSNPQWIAGGVTPTTISVATNWTELTAMVGQKVDGVAIQNVVSDALGNLTEMMRNWEDIGLHTDGTGSLATLNGAPANKTVTVNPTPFGTRNMEIGQVVDIVNPAGNVTRGSLPIANKNAAIGSAQTFTYITADVQGAANADIVRYGGLTDGVPKWINGLKYLVSFSTVGELHGINRNTPQVVANGFDMGGSPITRSAIQLLKTQRAARINEKKIGKQFWYTHRSQIDSIKEIGYDLQYIPLNGGEAQKFDPFFRGGVTLDGDTIKDGQHADQQAWYLLAQEFFGKVKFSDPFWAMVAGSRVYNTYNQGGTPNLQYASCYINPEQFYLDNAVAQGVISGCGVPSGSIFGIS